MNPEFLLQLLAIAGVGVGVYAGIRADIARLHERVEGAISSARAAHERLDVHLDRRSNER